MSVLHVCLCAPYMSGAHGGYKRALESLDMGLQTVVSHAWGWELNVSSLEEQRVLITAQSAVQPWVWRF